MADGIVHPKMKICHYSLTFKLFQTMEVNNLVTNILQNNLFCVQQKKETHTGLEQLEGE